MIGIIWVRSCIAIIYWMYIQMTESRATSRLLSGVRGGHLLPLSPDSIS
jgi:hypothetical protein